MSEVQSIPRKSFYRRSEVCQFTKTQPYVLRFWESEFPQLAPDQRSGGQSVYRRKDIDMVLRIKQLLYDEEYTIAGARKQLERELSGSGAPRVARTVRRRGGGKRAAARATEEAAETPDGELAPAPLDSVPRERYEDAVDEIAHLRRLLQEAEARSRKAEAGARRAESDFSRERERTKRAIERLEGLLEQLG